MQAMKLMLDKYSLECSPTLLENKIADLNRILLMKWSFTGVYSGTRDIFIYLSTSKLCYWKTGLSISTGDISNPNINFKILFLDFLFFSMLLQVSIKHNKIKLNKTSYSFRVYIYIYIFACPCISNKKEMNECCRLKSSWSTIPPGPLPRYYR